LGEERRRGEEARVVELEGEEERRMLLERLWAIIVAIALWAWRLSFESVSR